MAGRTPGAVIPMAAITVEVRAIPEEINPEVAAKAVPQSHPKNNLF